MNENYDSSSHVDSSLRYLLQLILTLGIRTRGKSKGRPLYLSKWTLKDGKTDVFDLGRPQGQ